MSVPWAGLFRKGVAIAAPGNIIAAWCWLAS
jgi:hypothetical protein